MSMWKRWPPSLRAFVILLTILVPITGIGVALSSSTVSIRPAPIAPRAFTVDEATYYEYVAPRLDRLVMEMDRVLALVEDRSRNVISLSAHGTRIAKLAGEIEAFGRAHPVPPRFLTIHDRILEGADLATTTIAEARKALQRFDFSAIPDLIPRFEQGVHLLHQASDELAALAATPESRSGSAFPERQTT